MMLPYRTRNLLNRMRGWKAELYTLAGVGILSELRAEVIHADGSRENLGVLGRRCVTDAGVSFLASAFVNTTECEAMQYHASGTGTVAENVADTALGTEVATRVAGTGSKPLAYQYQSQATIPYTGTLAITEHGLLSAAAVGVLLDRTKFAAYNVISGDSIVFTYIITFTSGG